MIVNFEIHENVHLHYNGRVIDLHNNFDFISFNYDVKSRELKLTFMKSSGDWVEEEELSSVVIVHSNVFYYALGYDNEIYEFPEDDKSLAGITFIASSEREINNELYSRVKPESGDDVLYIFETEHYIRIGCDNIVLSAIV
jgi:hypothetical protein